MHLYEIINGTSTKSIFTDDPVEIEEFRQKKWWVSGEPIIWSGEGAKRVNDKWELEDVPVILSEPYVPHVLTPEEIKQKNYASINRTYTIKLNKIVNAIQRADAQGNVAAVTKLKTTYSTVQTDWKNAILAVV